MNCAEGNLLVRMTMVLGGVGRLAIASRITLG
jgi:hypothetical protein